MRIKVSKSTRSDQLCFVDCINERGSDFSRLLLFNLRPKLSWCGASITYLSGENQPSLLFFAPHRVAHKPEKGRARLKMSFQLRIRACLRLLRAWGKYALVKIVVNFLKLRFYLICPHVCTCKWTYRVMQMFGNFYLKGVQSPSIFLWRGLMMHSKLTF